jgi:hypothetical protein
LTNFTFLEVLANEYRILKKDKVKLGKMGKNIQNTGKVGIYI